MISDAMKNASHIKPVPVIASFSSKGELVPLYTTINGVKLKIEQPFITREMHEWIHFTCFVVDNNIRKQIQLMYKTSESVWFVPAKYFRN